MAFAIRNLSVLAYAQGFTQNVISGGLGGPSWPGELRQIESALFLNALKASGGDSMSRCRLLLTNCPTTRRC